MNLREKSEELQRQAELKKAALELAIADAIRKFHADTGLRVESIGLRWSDMTTPGRPEWTLMGVDVGISTPWTV